ncbi:hypothetical protein KPL71_008611 [Citrus sinensis]|uniref:Uncharacterized protein n=1 Tax=Citrus sinensis TaxID=2711 RepID=A0ACB8M7Y8_CITSI|nr:hypothetical protein KPL71_008611 [Citrus sinensis]
MLHRKATQLARNPVYHSKTKHIEIDNALHQKQGCTILKALPTKITMESPKTLVLSCWSKLKNFPEIVGSLASLMTLMLDGTALQELPLSIELLSGLDLLNLNDCNNLSRFPSTINESLEELDLSGTAVRQPVLSIFLLKNLKEYLFMDAKQKDLQHLGALKLCESKFRKINCVHCFKLFNNKDLVVSMLKDYPEKGSNPRPEYLSLVAPGNKIPSGSAIRMTVLGQQ